MARVEDELRRGELAAALSSAQDAVRRDPASAKPRVLLFQLLCVAGQWDRALTQLNVVGDLDGSASDMVQTYREVLQCEALRSEVFKGRRAPLIFGAPRPWMGWLVEALRLSGAGDHARARELRDQAFEAAEPVPGTVGEKPFAWIADADPRLGPMLEAIVNGRYYWIPLQCIRTIRFDPPRDVRDLVWMPAYFTWANEGEAVGFVPTRYPGSEASDDPLVQLGRKTLWIEHDGEPAAAVGQRMLTTDAEDFPLMELRAISLDVPPAVAAGG